EPHCIFDRELAFSVEPGAERLALHVRHDEERRPVDDASVEEREDVWVPEVGDDVDLALEPLPADGGRQLWAEDFDGDLALRLEVGREVDRRHAAATKLAPERVSV